MALANNRGVDSVKIQPNRYAVPCADALRNCQFRLARAEDSLVRAFHLVPVSVEGQQFRPFRRSSLFDKPGDLGALTGSNFHRTDVQAGVLRLGVLRLPRRCRMAAWLSQVVIRSVVKQKQVMRIVV